ncbi:MAG: hypothetical protein M1817_000745 [Caeruleum heppii]|nr:MAG: hypothetical protein M1817_000745 [Caeruleum heppii]
MNLLDLPAPAFELVILHATNGLRLYQAIRLREVCWLFGNAVTRVLFLHRFEDFSSATRSFAMHIDFKTDLLLARVNLAHSGSSQLSCMMQQMTDWLISLETKRSESSRMEVMRALCSAAADYLYTKEATNLLKKPIDPATGPIVSREDKFSASAAVGDLDQMKVVLLEGADPSCPSETFGDALSIAARRGDTKILCFLWGLPLHLSGGLLLRNALGRAIRHCHKSAVEMITGLEFQVINREVKDLVLDAAESGNQSILDHILSHYKIANNYHIMSKIFWQACRSGHLELVQRMLAQGTDVNELDSSCCSALQYAAAGGYVSIVRSLLAAGADHSLGRADKPLQRAVGNGHQEVVQTLLDAGVEVDGVEEPILATAARQGQAPMIRFLLARGVDLKHRRGGDRALQVAAARGEDVVVRLLVELGVDINGPDMEDPPLLFAIMCSQDRVVSTFRSLGARHVDPLQSSYAADFADERLPMLMVY